MKNNILLTLMLVLPLLSWGQCPTTPITLSSQAEVDAFTVNYPGCIEVDDLKIEGGDITNLNGLSQIEAIGTKLTISYNPLLADVSGLNNIYFTSGEGHLTVRDNSLLESIEGLLGVTHLTVLELRRNIMLSSLTGLESVTVEHLRIFANDSLFDLLGLEGVQSLKSLHLGQNENLVNINGLQNILFLPDSFIYISETEALTTLEGLASSESNGVSIKIENNISLANLNGLEGITAMNNYLVLRGNWLLHDISAIGSLGNNASFDELIIEHNPALSVCSIASICNYLDQGGDSQISDNASGCNSVAEVEAGCLLSVSEKDISTALSIYPIPVSETLRLNLSKGFTFQSATVYSILGERLLVTSDKNINVSNLSEGIYFIEVATSKGRISKKIVKE